MATIGSTPGIIVGVGVGAAASAAIEPALEIPKQEAWRRLPNRILNADLMARLVTQGGIILGQRDGSTPGSAYEDALRDGFGPDKLDRLIYLAQTVPGIGEALDLWRKGLIDDTLWSHSLKKQAFDARYFDGLNKLKHGELLGLGDLAYAVVRGLVPAPSWVPVAPPATGDKVPRFPVVNIDPIKEAAKLGYPEDLFQIMVGRSGLSLAPIMAANAWFRGLIGDNDFLLAIAEGDLRTEWAETVREVARQIPTAGEMAELELRGFLNRTQRIAQTDRHGMSEADSDHLYNVLGRAPSVHAITTGLARGATFPSDYTNVPEPYKSAIQRSNIRPEYAEIEYHDRYSYPSGFQIKAETQSGDLAQADAEQILLEVGWSPKWAKFFSEAWAKPKASSAASHVSKAQTQLWSQLHKSYLDNTVPAVDANAHLTTIGVPANQQADVLKIWNAERDLVRKNLTAKQIIKAASTDPVYGTEAQKLQALQDLGYSLFEAQTLLSEG